MSESEWRWYFKDLFRSLWAYRNRAAVRAELRRAVEWLRQLPTAGPF